MGSIAQGYGDTMGMTKITTAGGITGRCTATDVDAATALDGVWAAVDRHKGALYVSNYEVPNRYARWDTGFVNPPIELVVKGRRFAFNALNGEGERLLPLFAKPLRGHPHLVSFSESAKTLAGVIAQPPAFFPEEERSRQPSLFSVLRSVLAHFKADAPTLGFYGAFGFDLVFQFETLRLNHVRDPEQVDCVLFFPTELVLVDRQKEVATRFEFDFDTAAGPSREGSRG